MSYEYINSESKDTLRFRPSIAASGEMVLSIQAGGTFRGMHIPKTDVPTVATELLEAAGQESVIIPKAYEEVEQLVDEITCGSGPEKAYGAVSQNPNWLYNKAANYVALAQWIEGAAAREAAEKAETEAAEKKLQERRDALAREFTNGICYYESVVRATKRAIDRIIELEDGASRD